MEKVAGLSLSPELIKKHSSLKIVYTPIHGTGVKLVPAALKKMGFENVYNVPEQDVAGHLKEKYKDLYEIFQLSSRQILRNLQPSKWQLKKLRKPVPIW